LSDNTQITGQPITLNGKPISQIQRVDGKRVTVHNTAGERASFNYIEERITPEGIREALKRYEEKRERRRLRRRSK
jgi:hypothetical protein